MFNNFSILSELIVENRTLAERFLENLSSVYRYVIQNLKRDTVPVSEELDFLRSYLYLIGMRYENAISVDVDEQLERTDDRIPPVCLQLLVENAIKHNRLSVHQPLHIHVFREGNHIVVKNDLCPVSSDLSSTGIGQRNIIERYFLLCEEKPVIKKSEHSYIVKLPIIPDDYAHLIIEDEKRNFNRLKRLLEEIDGTFRIDGPLASIVEAVEWLQAHPAPELIFADIRLSDGLSFDVLRRTAVPSPVIFTTAYDEYAIQAFKYNSFDYLLKPVKADELAAAMEKVRRASSPQTNGEEVRQLLEYMRQSNYRYRERFLLPYRDGYISVQVKDISHIALDERNTLLCLNNGTSETVPYSLDELESQLNPDVFFRANRQYLIHIDSILSINNWFNSRLKIRLKKYPDVEIIVSRERAAELKGWLDR